MSPYEELYEDNKKLRYMLWLTHGCIGLYGDDGEMQCNCGNHFRLDFKRDSVDKIVSILSNRR